MDLTAYLDLSLLALDTAISTLVVRPSRLSRLRLLRHSTDSRLEQQTSSKLKGKSKRCTTRCTTMHEDIGDEETDQGRIRSRSIRSIRLPGRAL